MRIPDFNSQSLAREIQVSILGAGVIGLSTAILLQSQGFKTILLSDFFPFIDSTPPPPTLATAFAIASAYPHNLAIDELERVMLETQEHFAVLAKLPGSGVSRYRVFELYEDKAPEATDLGHLRMQFQTIEQAIKARICPPRLPQASIHGWCFETYFADMPRYIKFLFSLYLQAGGRLARANIDSKNLASLPGEVLINCLGIRALELFPDTTPRRVIRGKVVRCNLRRTSGKPFPEWFHSTGYNYTPAAGEYLRGSGIPEYLHFFPRKDGFLLGQTREDGDVLDQNLSAWSGLQTQGAHIELNGVAIPEKLLTLNQEILSEWLGENVHVEPLQAWEGYRYYRQTVRLELDSSPGRPVVHHYGHAGSGITASWGSARKLMRLLSSQGGFLKTEYEKFEPWIDSLR